MIAGKFGGFDFSVCVRVCVVSSPRLCAVKLMVELCLSTGLGKRKRVMDEKELMIPLELGYVQESRRKSSSYKVLHCGNKSGGFFLFVCFLHFHDHILSFAFFFLPSSFV